MNSASLKKLKECDDKLVRLILSVDEVYPVQVICGSRNKEDQNKAFEEKKSKLQYPKSKHNIGKEAGRSLSHAVDIVPDPDRNPKTIAWADLKEFDIMLLVVEQKADELGIKVRLGRDFSFKDYPHVELV